MSSFRLSAAALIGFMALTCGHGPVRADDVAPDPSKCSPQALVTTDNDIRLDGDDRPAGKPVTIPNVVTREIRNAAKALLAHVPAEAVEGLDCKDLFPQTYRISLAQRRQLYVAEIRLALGIDFFYLVVHDLRTGAVTSNPPRIGARSSQSFGAADPLVKKPFVSSADLFHNHQPQIVFEERVHNGTMYNAVVYHYFDIGQDLRLTRIVAVETRLMALEPDGAMFIRELTPLGPNRLRLDTFELPASDSAQRKSMGYVILESPGPGVPFRVAQRHLKNPKVLDCLVTCNTQPPDDDRFLREGYTFYY